MALIKATANQHVYFYAIDLTTGLPKTGLSDIAVKIKKQSIGAFSGTGVNVNAGASNAIEIDGTNLKGWYYQILDATDTNCDYLIYSGVSATSNVAVTGGSVNLSAVTPDVNVAQVNGSTTSAAGLAAMGLFVHGTCQGGSSTTLQLEGGAASSTNSIYVGQSIVLTGGTGAGQVRVITGYSFSSSIGTVTVDPAWTTTPVGASTQYILVPAAPTPANLVAAIWDSATLASKMPANANLSSLTMGQAMALVHQRFFGKVIKSPTSIVVKAQDAVTTITTQTYSSSGGTDTVNNRS